MSEEHSKDIIFHGLNRVHTDKAWWNSRAIWVIFEGYSWVSLENPPQPKMANAKISTPENMRWLSRDIVLKWMENNWQPNEP